MKSTIFLKFIFVLALVLSLCDAKSISKYIKDLKDYKKDVENYLKVKNIERDIEYNESRTLDVYYNKDEVDEENLKPVIIHIYGGTWKKGNKVKFTKIGSFLEENDYVAVLPNYGLFPFAVFEDMVYDVYTAINWTFENIKKYGGDPKRITITSHSAGAHLTALTLFKSYNYMENNGVTLKPLPAIEKIVFLAGPFDFDDYKIIKKEYAEADEDETINNSLVEKFVKVLFRTRTVSPHDVVRDMNDNSVDDSFNVKKFVFYYTSKDEKVPEASAKKLMNQMKRVCPNVDIEYVYKEGYAHSDIVNGVRWDIQEQKDIYLSLIRN